MQSAPMSRPAGGLKHPRGEGLREKRHSRLWSPCPHICPEGAELEECPYTACNELNNLWRLHMGWQSDPPPPTSGTNKFQSFRYGRTVRANWGNFGRLSPYCHPHAISRVRHVRN